MNLLNRLGRFFDTFIWVFAIGSGILIISITLLTDYEVFTRYVLGSGQSWVTEIIDNLLLYLTFFGVAWVLKEDGHVSIDLLYSSFSTKTKINIDLVIAVLGIVACSIITWHATELTINDFLNHVTETKTVGAPRGLILGIIPFGFITLTIQFIRNFYGHFLRWKSQTR